MKHKIYILIIMLTTIVFVSQSCKKEETVIKNDKTTLKGAQGGSEDNTEELLISFINKLDIVRENQGSAESSNWNYTQDSMIWYLESALNYKYAFPNHERSKLILDSMFIEIAVPDNGIYNISKILDAYDNSLSIIEEKFDAIEAEHKLLVSVDYSIKSRDNNVLTLVAYIYFGKFGVNLPRGDWKIFGGQFGQGGLCGTNTYLNYDACDRLEQQEFAANTVHQLNVFFTDYSNDLNSINNISMSSSASGFNYTPYNIYWFYDEGLINITQNPNYPWASCLTVYYMDQYELNIKEMSSKSQIYNGKSLVLVDLVADFFHKFVQGDEFMSQSIYPWSLVFANSHPRLFIQVNDFYQ